LRNDLYFRLNVVPVELPALKDRRADIEPIVRRQLERLNERYGAEKSVSRNGIMGLGQPLKSFRDSHARFPPYETGAASAELNALGELEIPGSPGAN